MLPGDENDSKSGFRSSFSDKNENASPGYYGVLLDDYNINAELKATSFRECSVKPFLSLVFPLLTAEGVKMNPEKLKPPETGIIQNFTIKQRKREDYFGYIYSGYLDVSKGGIYTFSVKVNDKCTLYLDGKEFLHGGFKTIALRKGKYKIDEKYF